MSEVWIGAGAVPLAGCYGKHYLAMEYVHGADLRAVLAGSQRTVPGGAEAAELLVPGGVFAETDARSRCSPRQPAATCGRSSIA